jgi:hypothetical protein
MTQWSTFLRAWHECYDSQAPTLARVVADLRSEDPTYQVLRDMLPEDFVEDLVVRGGKDPSRLERRLGNAFAKLQDRYFEDGLHLEKAGAVKRTATWRVVHEQGNTQ